jgi:hypothetical protein
MLVLNPGNTRDVSVLCVGAHTRTLGGALHDMVSSGQIVFHQVGRGGVGVWVW